MTFFNKNKTIIVVITSIIAAIILVSTLSISLQGKNQAGDSKLILKEIKQIAELFTIRYYSECVVQDTEYKLKNGKKKKVYEIVSIAKGTIIAGIDLASMKKESFTKKDNGYLLTVNPPKIISTIINPLDYEIEYYKNDKKYDGEIKKTEVDFENLKKMDLMAREKINSNAVKNGILSRSSIQGAKLLRNFFETLDRNVTIDISFKKNDNTRSFYLSKLVYDLKDEEAEQNRKYKIDEIILKTSGNGWNLVIDLPVNMRNVYKDLEAINKTISEIKDKKFLIRVHAVSPVEIATKDQILSLQSISIYLDPEKHFTHQIGIGIEGESDNNSKISVLIIDPEGTIQFIKRYNAAENFTQDAIEFLKDELD